MGMGGIFIETAKPVQQGMFTDFNFTLPGRKKPVRLSGLVRWYIPGKGFGIEFFHATREERDRLRSALRRLGG
jgi:hypothetical protein